MTLVDSLQRRSDVMVAMAVVVILAVMILPIPPFLLDIFLSLSLSLSIVILIRSIFVSKPLDFSVFPTVLLFATLYRLALNVASTRLILLKGHEGVDAAGQVIKSFGKFVVGGNYAVGLIVFLILVVINFVVITKGAGRIAEVAARFTLDGMPGKQMAIDADLNAGLIDETEARRRRALIAQEADFYGAMDGASKFVRGDAIAGLIITGINIIGGLIIGTLQQGMPLSEAARTYTILTIGDGLVAQIPALLVSTSAGIVVSRAGSEMDLGRNILLQVIINPKALVTVSVILVVMAMVPGLPKVPFLLISAAFATVAYVLSRPPEVKEEEPEETQQEEPPIEPFLAIEPLTLEIGYGLIPLVEQDNAPLLVKIRAMRRQLASELGFIVPSIHIKDNLQLKPHEYAFIIRGIEVGRGEIMMGHQLAVASEGAEELKGIPTREPAFGLPAYWIKDEEADGARTKGYMVVDVATVIVTHITELIKGHAWELLTRSEVQSMLDSVAKTYPRLVDELIPDLMTLGGVQRVLQNLLKERVPINDLVTILETLVDYASTTKDIELLTEYVRQSLARFITKQYAGPDGNLHVLALDSRFEVAITESIEREAEIGHEIMARLLRGIEKALNEFSERYKDIQPIVLTSPQTRRYVRKIVERFIPSLVILSTAEILPSVRIYTVGVVKYED